MSWCCNGPFVEAVFERFGAIKAKGVSIRPQKQGTDRYAFVEYEDASGAAAAIESHVEMEVGG